MTRFIVIQEHTLGCVNDLHPNIVTILQASILRGAIFTYPPDGWCFLPLNPNHYRPATRADFTAFRIVGEGYEQDKTHYDFPTT